MNYKLTFATAQGRRSYQEDRMIAVDMELGHLLGVFDGHGGAEVSEYAKNNFALLFADALAYTKTIPEALGATFSKLNSKTEDRRAGSTASIAFIPHSFDVVHTAVLGDSPIIVKQADGSIWHGPDHNVRSNKAEAEAAQRRGGIIYNGYLMSHFSGNGLQMARALGDDALSSVLDRNPDISSLPLGPGSFVLVATDGAFDPSHAKTEAAAKDIVLLIETGRDAQFIVEQAVNTPTYDNVTAVLVKIDL